MVARVYDPHGWAAPILITGKILMQSLWIIKTGWYAVLPQEVAQRCLEFYKQFPELPSFKIDRWTGMSADVK